MTIYEHLTEFAGKAIADWEPGQPIGDPAQIIHRISISWDESDEGGAWADKFARFLETPNSNLTTGIVVGPWEEMGEQENASGIVDAIADASDRLPRLTALFFGDIIVEESEISWIEQCDVAPLLAAYPRLEHFAVRGGNGLRFSLLHHENLKSLIVQTGGLPKEVVADISAARLTALRHLELWLGVDDYGGDTTVEDLAPILSGDRFPALTSLGLRDSEIADQVASAVASAPILERIEVLDLSLGTLTDEGAAALLASPAVPKLRKLDLHHHYCSEEMVARLTALPIEVDAGDRQEVDESGGEVYRYVSVSE
jgi:hypothetical protein